MEHKNVKVKTPSVSALIVIYFYSNIQSQAGKEGGLWQIDG